MFGCQQSYNKFPIKPTIGHFLVDLYVAKALSALAIDGLRALKCRFCRHIGLKCRKIILAGTTSQQKCVLLHTN